MEDTINEIIIEHFGISIFIMVVIVSGIIALTWWCANVYHQVKKIDSLPCDKHGNKMNEHDNAVSSLNTSITFLAKEIDTAMRMFQQQNPKAESFTRTQSPLSITEKGWEMVHRLSLDKMFDNNWTSIRKLIDTEVKEKSAYDIDDFCVINAVVFPDKFLSKDEIDILKNDAFKNGLSLASYMKVLAVMARDRYFKENGIEMSDIDRR